MSVGADDGGHPYAAGYGQAHGYGEIREASASREQDEGDGEVPKAPAPRPPFKHGTKKGVILTNPPIEERRRALRGHSRGSFKKQKDEPLGGGSHRPH